MANKKDTKQTVLQALKYQAGGALYFWSAWTIITFGSPKIGLWWANIVGNAIGIVLNYIVQRFWAFTGSKHIFNSGWKFLLLTIANLGLSYVILKSLVQIGVALWFAQFLSAGFFTVWNWVWYKYWVFRSKR